MLDTVLGFMLYNLLFSIDQNDLVFPFFSFLLDRMIDLWMMLLMTETWVEKD